MFGFPLWIEIILWFVLSLGAAISVNSISVRVTGTPSVAATGFLSGCALGPIAILGATSPATRGNRAATAIGGGVGTLVYLNLFGII